MNRREFIKNAAIGIGALGLPVMGSAKKYSNSFFTPEHVASEMMKDLTELELENTLITLFGTDENGQQVSETLSIPTAVTSKHSYRSIG